MDHTVVINSIGTATPATSKVLSDALKVPQDYILKLLYNAPSILFQKVDGHTASKAEDTLAQLGLEVSVCTQDDTVDLTTELVDISVGFDNVLLLPKVTEQLASFLGCKASEALHMVVNNPSIVLGNVSVATAEALQKRVDAEVYYSNPKKDVYTILIGDTTKEAALKNIERQLKRRLRKAGAVYVAEDVAYQDSQWVWRTYRASETVKLINQSHQSVHVVLDDFDLKEQRHRSFLIGQIGMPEAILEDVHSALPITLCSNVNRKKAEAITESCLAMGIQLRMVKDFNFKKKLRVTAIENVERVTQVLGQFIAKADLPNAGDSHWESKEAMPPLIARYLSAQLEQLHCNPEIS